MTGSLNTFFPLTRRQALEAGAAVAIVGRAGAADAQTPATRPVKSDVPTLSVRFTVNGTPQTLTIDTRTTLLDALREHLDITGPKKGCDHGQCGACTVLLDGRRINSCLTLAVMHDGQQITTIEGLGVGDKLHQMQTAFIHHDGYQCGYCTPGQICSAVGMLSEHKAGWPSNVTDDLMSKPTLTGDELRERMSGNLCRCGAYNGIVDAIQEVFGEAATAPATCEAA